MCCGNLYFLQVKTTYAPSMSELECVCLMNAKFVGIYAIFGCIRRHCRLITCCSVTTGLCVVVTRYVYNPEWNRMEQNGKQSVWIRMWDVMFRNWCFTHGNNLYVSDIEMVHH